MMHATTRPTRWRQQQVADSWNKAVCKHFIRQQLGEGQGRSVPSCNVLSTSLQALVLIMLPRLVRQHLRLAFMLCASDADRKITVAFGCRQGLCSIGSLLHSRFILLTWRLCARSSRLLLQPQKTDLAQYLQESQSLLKATRLP